MAESRISVRVNGGTKQQAEEVFEQLGLSLSAGISVYLAAVARARGIPFKLEAGQDSAPDNIDNADLLATMEKHERLAQALVDAEIAKSRANGLPVALYDSARKEPYLLFADGTRQYPGEQNDKNLIKTKTKTRKPKAA